MLQLEDIRLHLEELEPELTNIAEALGLEAVRAELREIGETISAEGFWERVEASSQILKRQRQLENTVSDYESLRGEYEDLVTMVEIANEEDDESMVDEIKGLMRTLDKRVEQMRLDTLLAGEYDQNNAILTIHAGAGGTEAQDWAQMLYRMYTRWGEQHGFKVTILDLLTAEEAGIKSASILIHGVNAYGYLKSEAGVHRLVRISPFDSSGRRHTSFASVEVMPEIEDDTEIVISDADLKVDTYRASGAGGQHVNKTESAIRITHLPTGIVVACQNERSQHQNRDVAMKMLRAKLAEIKEREHLERVEDIKGEQKEIAWGSQIRSYVFMPYTLVKDHRTGFESGNIGAVMNGELDEFINAYLKAKSLGNRG